MPTPSNCWPGVDLDGYKELNPPEPLFKLYWNAEILDVDGIQPNRIIRTTDDFVVRFRIEIVGDGWKCMAGEWRFDLAIDEQGGPQDFMLSSKLPAGALNEEGWRGCDSMCVEKDYRVPAGTIDPGVYEITARFRLYCCDQPGPIVGFDPLEEWMWYRP